MSKYEEETIFEAYICIGNYLIKTNELEISYSIMIKVGIL